MTRAHGFPPGNSNMTNLERELFILDSQLVTIKNYLDVAESSNLDTSVQNKSIKEIDRMIYDLIEIKARIAYIQGKNAN